MNKVSLATLNKIEEAKGQAKYTGYFWIIIVWFSIIGTSYIFSNYSFENKIIYLLTFFVFFIEFIFIYLSLFKFSRLISIITPIIFLSIIIFIFFKINEPVDSYFFGYLNFVKKIYHGDQGASIKIILFLIPILPFYFFYKGIKGSFKYHEFMKEKDL